MKKLIASMLVIPCILFSSVNICAEEANSSNIVSSVNSGFEDASTIEDTQWYKLVDSFGDSKKKSLSGLEIKTGSAYSGDKYLSYTATPNDKSWFSPAINLHPFFKEAGAGEYILSFYFRTKAKKPTTFMVRGLQSDLEPDLDTFPSLVDRGGSNYYFSYKGTTTSYGEWALFQSEVFEVSEQSLEKDHNWWFVLGISGTDSCDIDDFCIVPALDYVDPNLIAPTDISYLSQATLDSVFDRVSPSDTEEIPINPSIPAEPEISYKDITLYACLGIGSVSFIVALVIVLTGLKKKKD